MAWQPCDLYQCSNAACRSKVLILQPPRASSGPFSEPICICGHILQRLPFDTETPLRSWTF